MSISKYFTPVQDASVTFDGANVKVRTSLFDDSNDDIESQQLLSSAAVSEKPKNILNDLTFKADEGEVVLVLGAPTSELFQALFHGHKSLKYKPCLLYTSRCV